MATKKVSPANDTAIVRFTVGHDEITAANEWRAAGDKEVSAAVGFYNAVIAAHGVPLSALAPVKAGERRSNEAQAAFDFVRRVYAVLKCGDACAALLFDANVKGEAMVQREGLRPDGRPYAVQSKRATIQTIFGSDWAAFRKRMELIAADGAEADKAGGAGTRSTDMEYVSKRIGEVLKRLTRDVEKQDGSIPVDRAGKMALSLADFCKAYGIK